MMASGPETVALAAEMACLLEASAPKPGNVTRCAEFSDTRYIDFLASAAIVGHVLRSARRATTGALVFEIVAQTARLVGRNTNLGIALLFAPVAKAALLPATRPLRSRLRSVLASLTPRDGQRVYEAIRLASPGGLGEAARLDVRTTRGTVSLLAAMRQASARDSIAREYVTDFELTFTVGVPTLAALLDDSREAETSIVQTYLTLLAGTPDSLVARKCGARAAVRLSRQAAELLAAGGAMTRLGRERLAGWDRTLRGRRNRLNPGTTADLTAAAIFIVMLERGIGFVLSPSRAGRARGQG
jgi:triphosphoribosyl-dephospho-CoA synthase